MGHTLVVAADNTALRSLKINQTDQLFAGLLGLAERHPEQLKPVPNQPETEFARDALLDLLDVLVAELDDAAGSDIDEVVVVLAVGLLVAATALAESVAFQNAAIGEQAERPVDG